MVKMRYVIKCDECKKTIGYTNDMGVSARGGKCSNCKKKYQTNAEQLKKSLYVGTIKDFIKTNPYSR